MALVLANRVQETTATTGTGTITLAGAVSGYQSFAVIGNGNTTYYTLVSGVAWEVGIGTYTTAGTTLARTTVLSSSAAGARITLAGTSTVFVAYPAEDAITDRYGLLPAANGGTGQTLYTTGDLLYASGATTLSKLSAPALTNALISAGSGLPPAWGKISLSSTVSGTLPVANGGTSFTTYAVGDLLYASTTSALAKLADVATGSALISGGVSTAPSWGKIGLTTHVSGTLPVANGGTNAAAFTAGSVVFAGTSGTYTQKNSSFFWDNTNNRLGIGTAAPGYPLEVNGEARASSFTTLSGTQTLANATGLTLLTLSGATPRAYLVSFVVNAAAGTEFVTSLVVSGNNGSGAPSLVAYNLTTATQQTITVTATTIVGTQNSGISQTVSWSITRIM